MFFFLLFRFFLLTFFLATDYDYDNEARTAPREMGNNNNNEKTGLRDVYDVSQCRVSFFFYCFVFLLTLFFY